jgi:zinc/manganese transport system substrate-binding protein
VPTRALLLPVAAFLIAVAGCNASGAQVRPDGRINVVAAESFWGSIAQQLGGSRVRVTSLVRRPGADPHDYEPTAADARALAVAGLAIVNGAGYDPWASRLLAVDAADGRKEINVGDLVGVHAGGNPHRWYSPPDVQRVVAAITSAYRSLDPRHASYFAAQRARLESRGLARYRSLIESIRRRFSGTPVGASESILEPLAAGLGLRLVTPTAYMNAVSEGTEPTAAAKSEADAQIAQRRIRLWVYNSQNATPDVSRLSAEARAHGIPVVTISETPTPAGASFQDWQSRQLAAIERALGGGR